MKNRFSHWPIVIAITFVAVLINSVTLLSAFEAHVINVTATIERRPNQCDALSPGYWRNHEGCSGGAGESVWASQINALSSTFSGVFSGYSGAAICAAEWQPNCPSALTREGRLCRAKLHTLADELNLVSGRLDLNALIAGADRGGGSFDRLGLSPSSTVAEALTAVEGVIAQHEADATLDGREWLVDASQVAERIYSFYEDENPIAPQCIFSLDSITTTDAAISIQSAEPVQQIQIDQIVAPLATTTPPATTTIEVIEATTTPIATSTEPNVIATTTVEATTTAVETEAIETVTDQLAAPILPAIVELETPPIPVVEPPITEPAPATE